MMREEVSRLASGLFAYYTYLDQRVVLAQRRGDGGTEQELMAQKKRSTAYRAYHIANCQLSQQQTSSPKQIPGVNNQSHTHIQYIEYYNMYTYTIYTI